MHHSQYSGSRRGYRGGSSSFTSNISSLRDAACRPINPRSADENVGKHIHTFHKLFKTPSAAVAPATIKDVVDLGSYSWSNRDAPTILVPGSPPVWQDGLLPFKAKPDSGVRFIDANAAKFPEHPLEATVSSILHVTPGFDLLSKDVVANRNTLRKIIGWATDTRSANDDFRIDVDLLGEKTVVFTRWEKASKEQVVGFAGFNRNFEERMTVNAPGCSATSSHSKIVGYNFGKLEMVVSFDVDACVDPGTRNPSSKSSGSRAEVDSLADIFSKPSLSQKFPSTPAKGSPNEQPLPLKIISEGTMRPHDTLVKLKTRSDQNPPDHLDGYIQLHLAGAKHLYIGRHTRGNFTRIEKYDFSTIPLSLDAGAVQSAISTLHAALGAILEQVRKAGVKSPKMTLLFQNGTLKLMERRGDSPRPISEKLLKLLEKPRS